MDFKGPWVRRLNRMMVALRDAPLVGKLVRRGITIASYTGRRSGRTFSTPVSYQRKGDIVSISVMMPDDKTWWRNFSGEGGPLTLELDGAQRTGHATSHRDDQGRVTVRVRL
ncbi:hypothetical protein ACFOWZ_10370 [Lentzea rhizosphaerae]|uniref:Deazaflavin-dependent oxidoreductase, nitroreductase family n=1 Tax=Lentzea rhizosphaerae TaxID=2041025 RepID=A0ABV8BRH4_9PSEU